MAKFRGSGCPICYGLDVFGDKWTLLILRDIIFFGKKTYGDFLASREKIATNILASRLDLIVEEGLATRTQDAEDKKVFLYRLTEKGMELLPVLMEIVVWSYKQKDFNPEVAKLAQAILKNRKGFIQKTRKQFGFKS